MVCSSNMNRSMEAHAFLVKKGFNVDSYGTGEKGDFFFLTKTSRKQFFSRVDFTKFFSKRVTFCNFHTDFFPFSVKLPGPSADRPNVYEFGLSYEEIHSDLKRKDKTLYTQNGILHMLDRNRRIKYGPQRLQVQKITLSSEKVSFTEFLKN